jgi:hypothetical protein
MAGKLNKGNIENELLRTYTIYTICGSMLHEIIIQNPVEVYYGKDHYFHRVFNGESVTLCPAPGLLYYHGELIGFVEVSWVPRDIEKPCKW